MLWRARGDLGETGSGRRIIAYVLIGFGLWNIIDVVGFHWLAGVHRVRVDVANPLPWDLGWLTGLGAVPLLAGAWLRGRSRGRGDGASVAGALSGVVLLAGAGTLAPTSSGTGVIAIFRPDLGADGAFAAVAAAGGVVADISPSGASMIVVLPDAAARWRLYRGGALLVGGGVLAGCGTQPRAS
jgi:hypothetical protein